MTPFEPVFEDPSFAPTVEPSLVERVKYRLGLSIPEKCRGWVNRDINSKRFLWWHLAPLWVAGAAAAGVARLLLDDYNPIPFLIGWAVVAFAQVTVFGGYNRGKFLRYNENRWALGQDRDKSPGFRRLG